MIRWLSAIVIAAAGTAATPAAAQRPAAAPIPVATDAPLAATTRQHHVTIAGRRIDYRARWSELLLRDATGAGRATISATSYLRDGAARGRPVMVFFNGGPGASSSPLHTQGFGPRRQTRADAAGKRGFEDNPATLLDVADLIFVDPVGTGFSRQLSDGGGKPYWSPAGDAEAVLALIRARLAAEGRQDSPLFVIGESYGGYRIGMMAPALARMNVAGVVLISPALDFAPPGDQAAIDALPTMAVAAWHHRRAAGDRRDIATVWEEARRFAQGDYAVALQQGMRLSAADRSRIAARIAALTGLSTRDVIAGDLRIDTQRFLEALIPGRIVGRLDTRITAARPDPESTAARPAAANDPALGLGRSNVIVSPGVGDYLRDELGVVTARPYQSLTLDVNFAWSWQPPGEEPGADWRVAPRIAALLRARPAARLLVLGGYYDLATPLLGVRYALAHADLPADRVQEVALSAGHTPFEGAANLTRVSQLLHQFVRDAASR